MLKPRKTPNRQEKYMGLAFFHASFSKDPNTQVGAVIVNKNNEICGTGYNGPPSRIKDNEINWSRPEKYLYIKHAEANAIDHSLKSIVGATLYTTGIPCQACMLEIVDSGISTVVYFDMTEMVDKNSMLRNNKQSENTNKIANLGKVKLIKFKGKLNWMKTNIDELVSKKIIQMQKY